MESTSTSVVTAGGETTSTNMHHNCPTMRRMFASCVNVPTVADALPQALNFIVTSGKHSFITLPVGYIAIMVLWFPFWILSLITTEWGVYALFVGTIFFVGRVILRLLAFPGSSQRVSGEIEKEFTKYSVRMLQSAATAVIELSTAVANLENNTNGNTAFYEISSSWKRVKSYRDRVLGMFYHVLLYIFDEQGLPLASPSGNNHADAQLNGFGNNRLVGDVGDFSWVSMEAQVDGRRLMGLLGQILSGINALETQAPALLNNTGRFVPQDASNEQVKQIAQSLFQVATEMKLCLPIGFDASGDDNNDVDLDEESDMTMDTVRRRLERDGGGSTWDAIKSSAAAILPMLDPAPHTSIFGLDVLRGTVLSRYVGASQLWIRRPGGGRIDGFHIPAQGWDPATGRNRKAVMYCNPNAGLIEVATGMSLAVGNCGRSDSTDDPSWVEFYTQKGFDVYLFNYAGFGRSHGGSVPGDRTRSAGCLGAFFRIWYASFISFKPTPNTLRADALAVGTHLINELGVESLVIHGESIGGMAAAGAARGLSNMTSTKDKVALLICDRTFSNLQAVAQRLVGNWTAPAITMLAPFWSTDVASDFLSANCPKVVAQDCADAIIADAGSLKSGISIWKEIRKETSTNAIAWAMEAPVEYRAADYENVGVRESRLVPSTNPHIQPPKWPADKHISEKDGFHFAACARRIGKLSTQARRLNPSRTNTDEEMGVELDYEGNSSTQGSSADNALISAWRLLACCDGLCGAPLGSAVKQGYDWTLTWLSCTVTFGGQVVARSAERRHDAPGEPLQISPSDFDCRPRGYERDENEMMIHPKPIPEVIGSLKRLKDSGDSSIRSVDHELSYCIGMLEYIVARLSAPQIVDASHKGLHFQDKTGYLLDLHCGHNNGFSAEERMKLTAVLNEVTRRA